jgi:hypothetical protein
MVFWIKEKKKPGSNENSKEKATVQGDAEFGE